MALRKMVWRHYFGKNYRMSLTDGFITIPDRRWAKPAEDGEKPFEARMAKSLYWDAKDRRHGRPYRPRPLHVWIVGEDGWLDRAPEIIRSLSENDTAHNYRIVIYGGGRESMNYAGGPEPGRLDYVGNWSNNLYNSGMKLKKTHMDRKAFKSAGTEILRAMHDYYESIREPPTLVLEDLGAAVQFFGDEEGEDFRGEVLTFWDS